MLERHHTDIAIRTKLTIGFTIVLTVMAVVGLQGILSMGVINQSLKAINANQFIPSQIVFHCNAAFIAWNRAILNHVLAQDAQEMDNFENVMHTEKQIVLEKIQQLSHIDSLSNKRKELAQKINDNFSQANSISERIIPLSQEGRNKESLSLIRTELVPIVNAIDEIMDEFLNVQKQDMENVIKTSDELYQSKFIVISLITLIALVISFSIIVYLSKYTLLNNIDELIRGAENVAKGNLKEGKVTILTKDKFGYLGLIFNNLIDNLDRNIKERERQREIFASVLIHDFKGPLIPIIAFTQSLIKENKDKEINENLSSLHKSLQYLLHTAENTINSLKRKKVIQPSFNPRQLVFNDFLFNIVGNFQSELDKKKIEILINNKPRQEWRSFEDIIVVADTDQLKILIERLLTNTLSYVQKKIEIEFTRVNHTTLLSFSGNGTSIDEKSHNRMIEEYFNISEDEKDNGIGFYSVKQIVENHYGSINIISSKTKGTGVEIRFPS